MKLNKKIFSSLIALSIMATSSFSAFAAELASSVDEESGMVLIENFISREELRENYNPAEPVVNVEKLDNATMSSVDAVYNNLYGKKTDEETGEYLYDIYRVTVTIADVGDLALGYGDVQQGIGLYSCAVEGTYTGDVDQVASKIKTNSLGSGFTNSIQVKDNAFYMAINTAGVTDPYPFWGDEQLGSKVDDVTIELVALIVLNAGDAITDVTLDSLKSPVNYIHLNDSVANQEVKLPVVNEVKFSLGESESNVKEINNLNDATIKEMFADKYYIVGPAVEVTGKLNEYLLATDSNGVQSTTAATIGSLVDAEGDGIVGSVVPVLVFATQAEAEGTYTFGTSATPIVRAN